MSARFITLLVVAAVLCQFDGIAIPTARAQQIEKKVAGALQALEGASGYATYAAQILLAEEAWQREDVQESRRRLEAAPESFRNWEWRHMAARLDESLDMFPIDAGEVSTIAVSPDGTMIAVGTESGAIDLWSVASHDKRGRLTGHTAAVRNIQFSTRRSRLISTSSDGSVRLWDLREKRQFLEHRIEGCTTTVAAISPEGTEFATGCLQTRPRDNGDPPPDPLPIEVWTMDRSEAVASAYELTGTENPQWLWFSPGGKQLSSVSSDGSVQSWNLEPGGDRAAIQKNKPVELTRTGLRVLEVDQNNELVAIIATDQPNRILIHSSTDGTTTLADVNDPVGAAAFSPNGKLFAVADDRGVIHLWDTESRRQRARLVGHRAAVRALAWSQNGRRLHSAGVDETIRTWDPGYEGFGATLRFNHGAPCLAISLAPTNDRLISAAADGSISIWETSSNRRISYRDPHGGAPCRILDLSADGRRFISGASDPALHVWDAETLNELAQIVVGGMIGDAAISSDGTHIAVASGNDVSLWNLETVRVVRNFGRHEVSVTDVTMSRDGQLIASASEDGVVRVGHIGTGLGLATINTGHSSVLHIDLDRSGGYLATVSASGDVKLWASRGGAFVRTLYHSDEPINRVRFSPDATRIALASKELILIDVSEGAVAARMMSQTEPLSDVQFSQDGQQLAVSSLDGWIRILDARPVRKRLDVPIRVRERGRRAP